MGIEGDKECVQNLVGKPERERTLGRPMFIWEDNIRKDLVEVEWEDGDWIPVARDRDQWQDLVTIVANHRVP
jgi:hypothetical protein